MQKMTAEDKMVIEANAARCKVCDETLISLHVHDFKECSCTNLMVDGGTEYIRRGYKDKDKIEELSIIRKEIDYDDMSYDDMLILLDAFEKWETLYELVSVEEKAWLGLYKRFAKRWIPVMKEEFHRLESLDK